MFCFCADIFAQTAPAAQPVNLSVRNELDQVMGGGRNRPVGTFDLRYQGVKGGPFLYEQWHPGALQLRKDSSWVQKDLQFKLDIYQNEVWIRNSSDHQKILYNDEIMRLALKRPDAPPAMYVPAKLPGYEGDARFCEALYEGKRYDLLLYRKKVYLKADLVDNGITKKGEPFDRFVETEEYYIRVDDHAPTKAKLQKKNLSELPNRASEEALALFCKQNRLKGKLNTNEAIALLQFMDRF